MKTVRLSDFVENPDNPSTASDAAFDRLVEKLRRVPDGLTAHRIAFVTDRGSPFVVLSGNKRLRALKRIHGQDAKVNAAWFQDITAMSPDQRREFIVTANVSDGEWDVDKLLAQYSKEELADLIPADDLDDLLENIEEPTTTGETDPDTVPESPADPLSQRGSIYALGNHLLMCGDATSPADVANLMAGQKADLVVTDPPYNVSIGAKNRALDDVGGGKSGRVKTDMIGDCDMTDDECGEKLWKPAFANMQANAADHCAIYVTMPQGGTHMMMMMMMRSSWQVKHELMWLKSSPTFSMGRLDYDYRHEPICYGWNKTHRFFGKGDHTKSVWEIDKPRACDLHPTMKPVELFVNMMQNSSQKGEIVLDLFGGSGTTALAAETTGRSARLMEISPHYCDVIRKRWAEFVHGEGCDWAALTPEIQSPS